MDHPEKFRDNNGPDPKANGVQPKVAVFQQVSDRRSEAPFFPLHEGQVFGFMGGCCDLQVDHAGGQHPAVKVEGLPQILPLAVRLHEQPHDGLRHHHAQGGGEKITPKQNTPTHIYPIRESAKKTSIIYIRVNNIFVLGSNL